MLYQSVCINSLTKEGAIAYYEYQLSTSLCNSPQQTTHTTKEYIFRLNIRLGGCSIMIHWCSPCPAFWPTAMPLNHVSEYLWKRTKQAILVSSPEDQAGIKSSSRIQRNSQYQSQYASRSRSSDPRSRTPSNLPSQALRAAPEAASELPQSRCQWPTMASHKA